MEKNTNRGVLSIPTNTQTCIDPHSHIILYFDDGLLPFQVSAFLNAESEKANVKLLSYQPTPEPTQEH